MAVFAEACIQRDSRFSDTLSSARGAVAQGILLYLFAHANTQSGAEGHVSGTVDYDISVTGSGGISALVFACAGKPYDSVTGLSDYGFRDYAPTLARFTTVDPICAKRSCDRKFIIYVRSRERAIRDGSNWYAYCNADPVNYVDAWGLAINDIKSTSKGTTTDLSSKIDTPAFAQTICSNSQYLDSATSKYVDDNKAPTVNDALNNIKVVTGVDASTVDKYAKELGLNMKNMKPSDGDAFSIGGYIFIFEENFDTSKYENKYLLKHEAVHYIQSVAEGGTASFLSKYIDSVQKNGYNGSEYEMAAYSFGPNVNTKSNYTVANGSGFVK